MTEKYDLTKNWNNPFLNELTLILEKCFLPYKNKKEHFITKENLEIEIIRLLQSQKRFQKTDSIKENLNNLAAFDNEKNIICRIDNIDFTNNKITVQDVFNDIYTTDLDKIDFFDFTTLALEKYFMKQNLKYKGTDYNYCYKFLLQESKIEKQIEKKPQFSFNNPKY